MKLEIKITIISMCTKGDPAFPSVFWKVFTAVATMLSLRVVTLLSLWFCLASLMPGKHYLVKTEDESVKGKPNQNKALIDGVWPSAGFFEASSEALDGQSMNNKNGMTNESQKVNVNKSTRWTWYK